MLGTDERRLYSEAFAAPEGHRLDTAVGTTYSLDLESLLFAHVCLATSGRAEPEDALRDPVSLLEAVHRTSDRVTVFYHAGETNAPSQPQAVYALLEDSVVPARGRGGSAIFHPKLWLLRFVNEAGDGRILRAVVLSRNLTTSRAWDSFVCLEGEPGRAKQAASLDLDRLLRALPGLAKLPVPPARAEALESLARDAERTAFDAPYPFEGTPELVALGLAEREGFRPSGPGERVLAISPFVSNEALRALRGLGAEATLIGRPEEMSKCDEDVIGAWVAHGLHDAASSDADSADDQTLTSTADAAPQGLHAKALAIQNGRRTTWWLGSANLTDPVRAGSSVELMVKLEGKTSKVGIDVFLESGFRDLLQPYQHAPPPADPREGARSAVERTKNSLVEATLTLRCDATDEGWNLVMDGRFEADEHVRVSARPISLPSTRSRDLSLGVGPWRFEGLATEALTALIALHIEAGSGAAGFEQDLTLKLPIEGLPAERDALISRAIVKDRSAVLRYLHCLLGDQEPDGAGDAGSAPGEGREGTTSAATFASGLLEPLLRVVHRDPERLRTLRALVERPDGDEVIPPELRAIWLAVEPHLTAKIVKAEQQGGAGA